MKNYTQRYSGSGANSVVMSPVTGHAMWNALPIKANQNN